MSDAMHEPGMHAGRGAEPAGAVLLSNELLQEAPRMEMPNLRSEGEIRLWMEAHRVALEQLPIMAPAGAVPVLKRKLKQRYRTLQWVLGEIGLEGW